jgi:ubiquinone/menaquinone biosynthesis C-methylase UbiE
MVRTLDSVSARFGTPTGSENDRSREKRLRHRTLFDPVAALYDAARPTYRDDVVDHLLYVTGLGHSSRVLEVGCGTGQLTGRLAARGVLLTAIDIGTSMVAAARRRVPGTSTLFHAVSFEDLVVDDGAFDAVVAADAFHWIDPEVRFSKTARVLRPGGWLAVLSLQQLYDEPLRTALQQMWVARSDDGDAWIRCPGPTIAEEIAESALFDRPVEVSFSVRVEMQPSSVLQLESTRATALSWKVEDRRAFTDELRLLLPDDPVGLTQVTTMTFASTRPFGSR